MISTPCVRVWVQYMFGGEFSNPNGEKFRHFNDLWRLDLETNEWEELNPTGLKPSPRSGHRMVVWKNLLVLFGGFYDTYSQTRYFNDVRHTMHLSLSISLSLSLAHTLHTRRSGCGIWTNPSGPK